MFDAGATAAKDHFESYVETKVDEYKDERYSGLGALLAVTDFLKLTKLPPEVDAIYQAGREQFLAEMNMVIDNVTQYIGSELNRAKATVTAGRQEIQQYVASLPATLRQVGQQASAEIAGKFDELEQAVDAKQSALIDSLANKYQEHLQAVDASIQAKKDANKSLWDMAGDLIGGVIKTIMQLKEMLLGVLARAGAVVKQIIMDPIGFLGNLVSGVKQGLQSFVGNIGTHLQNGLVQWLTGTIAAAGITLPEKWDLAGIFQLVMQLLGLGFETLMGKLSQLLGIDMMAIIEPIKQIIAIYQSEGLEGLARAGLARLIGEERMQALLQVWEMVQALIGGSWDKLWGLMMDQLTGLKEMVFGKIESFIAESVIKAGITWIIGLLNPASAFIKACKAIYDIVMFFVERGSQIMSLVNAIIDAIGSIAGGSVGAAASAVEKALATGIPVAIGFLASLLGLGNISEKVQEIVQSARALVDKGINAILNSKPVQMVVGFVRRVITKIQGALGIGKAGSEEINEAPESTHVKAEALDEAGRRLHQLERAEQIPGMLHEVRNQYQSQGSDSLTLEQDGTSGIAIVARASEPKVRTISWNEVLANSGTAEFKNAQLAFASYKEPGKEGKKGAPTVVAMITVNGQAMGSPLWNMPEEDLHAEDRVIQEQWPLAVERAKQGVAEQSHTRIVFAISATPCGRCSSNLHRIIGEAKKNLGAQGNDSRVHFGPAQPIRR